MSRNISRQTTACDDDRTSAYTSCKNVVNSFLEEIVTKPARASGYGKHAY
jgi:hypothetical protein